MKIGEAMYKQAGEGGESVEQKADYEDISDKENTRGESREGKKK